MEGRVVVTDHVEGADVVIAARRKRTGKQVSTLPEVSFARR